MEKMIELTPLAEIGRGCARITDNSVEIEISGISGGMKAWLIGGEAEPIGNIVDGRLRRKIDTRSHSGVLITQSGRQMLIGKYEEPSPALQEESDKTGCMETEDAPFNIEGFNWRKFTEKSFSGISSELRYIMSNRSIYDNYKKHGHYWVGESECGGALALKYDTAEPDPMEFLGKMRFSNNGYVIVCVDRKTKKLYIPD